MATADTTTGPAGIAMPMRDRLLGAVAAASPSSKGKMPLQLPPPPPGMPASQVEKWRKEVAKIVNKQQKEEMKLLKQREKEEDKIKREEEKMRAKVDKLAQKMLQQVANTRRSQPEVPLTQRWSPDGSPETSPRMHNVDPLSQYDTAEDDPATGTLDEPEPIMALVAPKSSADQLDISGSDKENARLSNKPATVVTVMSVNAAEEVSKALAARRERVEQAIQQKDEIDAAANPRLRELASEREREQLLSFERRIPNKLKLQEQAEERAIESQAQRVAKELPGKGDPLPKDLDTKRRSVPAKIEQCSTSEQQTERDPVETSFVIDEIPEANDSGPAPPCGIGVMIAQNAARQYVVVEMFPEGPAAKSGLLSVNDVIDFIDGQAVEGLQPEVVGKMIRGTPGTQVVFDIFGVHNMRRARIGITRWPVDRDDKRIARDSSDASEEQEHEVPKSRRRKPQRQAPLPPPPASQPELCDYDHSHNAIPTASSSAEQLPQAAASAPAFPTAPVAQVSGVMMCNRDNGVSRCGVGLGFEYQPARGVLVLRSLSVTGSPFALGDCLAEVNGTDVTSNAMLAPSLIFGDAGTPLHLKMTRGGDHANSVDATLIRNPSPEDANLMTMSGGAKTCGIGVVLELETNSRCFYVKRVVHGGPAFSAGVLQGDLVTQIDEADMRSFNKEQLPSLILGPEGTTLRMKLLRAGEVEQRELVITRFLDTAKAQQSNLASSAVLTFDYMESVGTPLQVERYSETLHSDIVNALLTVPKRISVVSLSLERGTANVYILPDFEGADTRSVEELVRDFVYQVSTKKSALRQTPTCASLSKIDVLGQVDPSQPKLELDTLFSAHMMLKASLLSTRCEPNEVVLPASPTSDDANTAAEPSPEGSLQPTPTTSDAVNENDISSPEENGLQPTLTASDAANSAAQSSPEESIRQPEHSVCAPKVLLIQRAPSHGHGKGTSHVERDSSEEVDASPVISAVDIRERETSKEMEESEPEHEVNAKVPDRLDDLEGDSEEGGYMAPGTEQVPEILPASTKQTELPICRKPSTCSGPDEGDTIDELSGDSPAPDEESPVSSDETTCANDSRQLSGSFSSSTGPAEPSADPVSELLVEPELPSPFEGLESVGEGSCEAVNVEAQTVAIEEETSVLAEPPSTVRSKSLKLLSLPAEVSTLAVESAQSTDVEAPPIAPIVVELAGVPVDVPAAGSALESIAALDSCGVQSVEEGKELGLSSEESPTEAFAKQDLKLDMTGLQAMGSDAWASGKYLYAQGATTSNVPCAPPRPSAVVAIQRACEGLHQEGITSAVSAVTAHKHGAKEMEEICEKFPHRIPVVVTKAEYSIAPDMLGSKYLVPMNITAKNLHILISKRIDELPDGMRLVLSVHNVPILANGNEIRQLYDAHKGLDGILYLRYDVEEGESHSDDAESAEPLEATAKGEELGGPSKSSSPIKMLSQGASVMELTSSFADTAQGRLKNWINLDGSVLKSAADDNEESISPLSLLIGFGSNLQQMAMPSDTNTKPQTSAPAPTPQARAEKREEGASRRPGTEPPPLQAGVGLKIERDVGGRGFRVAGVASDGPAANTVVKVNDYLVAVDNVPVKDMNTTEAANLLKGAEGTKVQLTLRKGDKMHIVTLIRSEVRQGKIKEPESRAPVPAHPKTDKVQIFGFSF